MRLDTSSFAGLAGPVTPVPLVAGGMAPPARSTSLRAASAASRVWSSLASGGILYAKPASAVG